GIRARLGRVLRDEAQIRGEVLRVEVDLAGLERRRNDLAVAEVETALHRVAVRLERLRVGLGEDELLGKVRGADPYRWLARSLTRRLGPRCTAHQCRQDQDQSEHE